MDYTASGPIGGVAFLASAAGTEQPNIQINTAVTVNFGVEVFDTGGNFTANKFTAPVGGKYMFHYDIYTSNWDASCGYVETVLKTSNRLYYLEIADGDLFPGDPAYYTWCGGLLVDMDAADTAHMTVFQSGGNNQLDLRPSSWFSGCLIA